MNNERKDKSGGLYVGSRPACVVVPAYDAAVSIGTVIRSLVRELACPAESILVVDDGSTDGTESVARAEGARVFRSSRNRGKGAALVRGFEEARALGFEVAVSVDADGQHPAASAREILEAPFDPRALVLGTRDLARDGAPVANQFSNRASNFFLSLFSGHPLADTQCGLRRYPIDEVLRLGTRADGFAFEAEVILRALAAHIPVVEHPVRVFYPPEERRVTHFHSVKDPVRIVGVVLQTLYDIRSTR